MHVPDGFINAPVSLATGAVAAAAVAVSLRGARRELAGAGQGGVAGAERTAPLAGLVAAFIFAVQMLNFPVAAGTSGHLLGGALAAILVGPYTGVLCVSVVLLMQGVLFADGGLTALGVNITDMAIVTTVVAYVLFRGLVKVLPRRRRSITVASFVAALVSVPAAAVVFTALYALGGTADVPIGKVFTAMVGVHVLIGIGEAAITALTVGAVIAVRPDLVHGARGLTAPLELRTSPLAAPADAPAAPEAEPVPAAAAAAPAAPCAASGWPGSPPPWCARAASATTPPPAPTAWRRSPTIRASTPRPGSTPPRTPRSPTTASRTSPTRGCPAASPGSSGSARRWPWARACSSSCAAARAPPPSSRPARAPSVRRRSAPEMGAGHAHKLYRHGHSPVHALPAHCKIAAVFCFVLVVVSTPREALWAFGLYAALLALAAAAARVPAGFLLTRLLIEVPFVAFALLMPFVAEGPRVHVGGLSLSTSGLWGAWNILAKGTLGVAASVLLAATTELRELLQGLQRLRMPPLLVQIASFMIRYGDVITDEMRRMRIARLSRGFEARGVRHWGVLAKSAGALFIRSYERGERVHLAMVSRGYTGTMPVVDAACATRAQWTRAAALPLAALAVCLLGWTL